MTVVIVSCTLFWASLVAQSVKNLPTMQETPVQFLGWEDPLEQGKATHSSILAWRIPWASPWGLRSRTRLSDFHFHTHLSVYNAALIVIDTYISIYIY